MVAIKNGNEMGTGELCNRLHTRGDVGEPSWVDGRAPSIIEATSIDVTLLELGYVSHHCIKISSLLHFYWASQLMIRRNEGIKASPRVALAFSQGYQG